MRRGSLFPFALALISFSVASAAGRLELVGAFVDPAASPAIKNALETSGHRVVLADGGTLCEVWLLKSAPAKPDAKAGYSALTRSEFLGVISFPKGAKDYRGQVIKPGTYTMRYEVLPNDGNHLGVAPTSDFVLLVPIAADADPKATYTFDQLTALSNQASATNHPAVFNLVAADGDLPRAYTTAEAFEVFATKLKLDSGRELPFALVVKGQAQQ